MDGAGAESAAVCSFTGTVASFAGLLASCCARKPVAESSKTNESTTRRPAMPACGHGGYETRLTRPVPVELCFMWGNAPPRIKLRILFALIVNELITVVTKVFEFLGRKNPSVEDRPATPACLECSKPKPAFNSA